MRTGWRRTATFAVLALLAGGAVLLSACTMFGGEDAADSDMRFSTFSDDAVEQEMAASDEIAPAPPGGAGEDAASVPAEDRIVIRSAGLRIEVDDIEGSVEEIRSLTAAAGGTVQALQVSTDPDTPIYRYEAEGTLGDGAPLSAYMTVRVPADELEPFTQDLAELGKVLRESSGEDDVTQEHIDLNARLENLQAHEQRLREFFDDATDVEDLLAVQQELSRVRGDIESMQAQIAYLERQAAMATVTIELAEPAALVSPSGDSWGFVEAITRGIRGAAEVVAFGISFLIASSPLWIFGLVVLLVIRAIVKKRRTSHAETPSGEEASPGGGDIAR